MAVRMAHTKSDDSSSIAGWIFFTVLAVCALVGLAVAATTAVQGHHIVPLIVGPMSFAYLLWCGYLLYYGITTDPYQGSTTIYREVLSAYRSLTSELQAHVRPLMDELHNSVDKGLILTPNDARVTSLINLSNHKLAQRGREHVDMINRLLHDLDVVDSGTKELQ